MKEILKKLLDNDRTDALESIESFKNVAREFGYSDEEIMSALDSFDGFPLDDDDMEEIGGGFLPVPPDKNMIRYRDW